MKSKRIEFVLFAPQKNPTFAANSPKPQKFRSILDTLALTASYFQIRVILFPWSTQQN